MNLLKAMAMAYRNGSWMSELALRHLLHLGQDTDGVVIREEHRQSAGADSGREEGGQAIAIQ